MSGNKLLWSKLFYFATNDKCSEIIESDVSPKMLSQGGIWTSLTCGYSSLDELIVKADIQPNPCSICGRIYSARYIKEVRAQLLAENICHSCHFWNGYVRIKNDPAIARIRGKHYKVVKETGPDYPASCKGYGGSRFIIRWNDGREITTTNLWHQGEIPDHFRAELPDNAIFVRKEPCI